MGLSGGENQEVLEREANTANPALSACAVHVCKSTTGEQRPVAGKAGRHGQNLKGNDLYYSVRKKIGAK